MTRVDFYHDAEDRLQVACRLVAKAIGQKLRVFIYAPDGETARAMDRLLWTTPAVGFLPHCMAHDKLAAETPVLIGTDDETLPHDDVLLNLGTDRPAHFARFGRLVEIVGRDEADRAAARERFKFYRERGYQIYTHSLGDGNG
ncbi:MAG: DNA polymerase III subunit chi [Burkholderiales bacterium]|nr:DNA polymerase III subunit chi [Burkholderiales bacterium]